MNAWEWIVMVFAVLAILAAVALTTAPPLEPKRQETRNGRPVVTTTVPQICWDIGPVREDGLHQSIPTGWHKDDHQDVWWHYADEEPRRVSIADLRARGHVAYPGETAAQVAARRDMQRRSHR